MSDHSLPNSVGLFGLGLIGSALAKRLMAAGIEVIGHDPTPECVQNFESIGGQPVLATDVWNADLVISAVFNTEQLEHLVDDAPQQSGKRLISMSTCDPAQMPAIDVKANAKGLELVEAPISGTSADLANGDAILLIAGDEATSHALAPVLNLLSRAHFFVGTMGNGNKAKLAINLILGLSRMAVAEGLVFAKAVGLDPATFFDIARESAAASKVMVSKGPKMVARDFKPLGRVTQSAKDFGLIYEAAKNAGQGLPMAERYLEVVGDNIAQGEGDLDNSAVMLAIERARMPWNK
ncbi:MAG: NAD-binding protein [Rhizobiaceae bacterium]|nr:NAD-binding protein [Rhizobiaceae bacterium]